MSCHVCTRRVSVKGQLDDIELYDRQQLHLHSTSPFPTVYLASASNLPLAFDHIGAKLIILATCYRCYVLAMFPPFSSPTQSIPSKPAVIQPAQNKTHGSLPPSSVGSTETVSVRSEKRETKRNENPVSHRYPRPWGSSQPLRPRSKMWKDVPETSLSGPEKQETCVTYPEEARNRRE
jgi:hypothetical protein